MGKHEATPVPATQAANPWRTSLRTMVQTGLPAFALALLLVSDVINEFLKTFDAVLPEKFKAGLLAAAGIITLASGFCARISALPRVIEFTQKYASFLAPTGKA